MDKIAIDKMDLKALRQADSIVFHADGTGKGRIDAIKRTGTVQGEVFSGEEDLRRDIPASAPAGVAGVEILMYLRSRRTWNTIASQLRAGDILNLDFRPDDGTCENHKNVGFHGDELYIIVERGKKVLSYLIAYRVGPENSARMCRKVSKVSAVA